LRRRGFSFRWRRRASSRSTREGGVEAGGAGLAQEVSRAARAEAGRKSGICVKAARAMGRARWPARHRRCARAPRPSVDPNAAVVVADTSGSGRSGIGASFGIAEGPALDGDQLDLEPAGFLARRPRRRFCRACAGGARRRTARPPGRRVRAARGAGQHVGHRQGRGRSTATRSSGEAAQRRGMAGRSSVWPPTSTPAAPGRRPRQGGQRGGGRSRDIQARPPRRSQGVRAGSVVNSPSLPAGSPCRRSTAIDRVVRWAPGRRRRRSIARLGRRGRPGQ
jgi:hypothetical protein